MGLDVNFYESISWFQRPGEFDPLRVPESDTEGNDYLVIDFFNGDNIHNEPNQPGLYRGRRISSFKAGSYNTYGDWRRALALKVIGIEPEVIWANPAAYLEKPFFFLIHFSDCEGTISGRAYEKLQQDFATHDVVFEVGWLLQHDIENYRGEEGTFTEIYQLWKSCVLNSCCVEFS